MHCGLCLGRMAFRYALRAYLCKACELRLKAYTLRAYWQESFLEGPLFTLFRYEQEVRQLILAAKAGRGLLPYAYLSAYWCREPTVWLLGQWAEVIVPAPSSLWSRFAGKFDLAYGLAEQLAKQENRQLLPPPAFMYRRWQKQAFRKKWQRAWPALPGKKMEETRLPPGTRVLLIDDVITSGATMKRLLQTYATCDCKIAALAYAAREATTVAHTVPPRE